MKPRLEIMVDLETLGTDMEAPVLMIAWVGFNLTNNEVNKNVTYIKYDKADVDISTLQWWLKTDAPLLADILGKAEVDEKTALTMFVDSVMLLNQYYDVHLWGNGILFDNAILKAKCIKHGLTYPIDYDKDRDMRTLVDVYCAKFGVTKASLKEQFKPVHEHDATDDCMAQIDMVKHMYGGMINGKVV